jgi:hypothetical protein
MRPRPDAAPARTPPAAIVAGLCALLAPCASHASFLSGEALDTAADYIAWGVLVIAPIVGIAAFWMVHILPEKIAEKKRHPQTHAIQTLCLLSLVFGGLLWPLAWLWAYTKPVLYRAAYGTDVMDDPHHGSVATDADATQPPVHVRPATETLGAAQEELARLKEQLDRLSQRVPTAAEVDAARARLAAIESTSRAQRGG